MRKPNRLELRVEQTDRGWLTLVEPCYADGTRGDTLYFGPFPTEQEAIEKLGSVAERLGTIKGIRREWS